MPHSQHAVYFSLYWSPPACSIHQHLQEHLIIPSPTIYFCFPSFPSLECPTASHLFLTFPHLPIHQPTSHPLSLLLYSWQPLPVKNLAKVCSASHQARSRWMVGNSEELVKDTTSSFLHIPTTNQPPFYLPSPIFSFIYYFIFTTFIFHSSRLCSAGSQWPKVTQWPSTGEWEFKPGSHRAMPFFMWWLLLNSNKYKSCNSGVIKLLVVLALKSLPSKAKKTPGKGPSPYPSFYYKKPSLQLAIWLCLPNNSHRGAFVS